MENAERPALPIEERLDRAAARLLARDGDGAEALEVYEDCRYRWLQNANGTLQSLMDPRAPERLLLPYTAAMMAALLFHPGPRSALLLGLGGASQARFLGYHFPGIAITAIEHDARVIAMAGRHFPLPDGEPPMRVLQADAHLGITGAGQADLIFLDLFGADGQPHWVGQPVLHRGCLRALTARGVLAANFWVDDNDEYLSVMDGLQKAFQRRSLVIALPGYRNLVALAFADTPCLDFAGLEERAAALGRHTGIDFAGLLGAMHESNFSNATGFVF